MSNGRNCKEMNFNINGVALQVKTSHESVFREFNNNLYYFKDLKVSNPDITMIIEDFKPPTLPNVGKNMHGDEKTLYWKPAPKLKFLLHNLLGRTEVKMTKFFRSILSDYLIPILKAKLIRKGYTMIHAGCVARNNNPILLSGFGGVGKSTTIALLLRQGYDYLGEDLVIVGRDEILPFPTPLGLHYSMLKKYNLMSSHSVLKARFLAGVSKILPKMTYPYVKLNPQDIGCKVPDHVKTSNAKLVLLEPHNPKEEYIADMHKNEFINKTLSQTHYWEDNMLRGLLHAYSYVDPDFNIHIQRVWERELVSEALEQSRWCIVSNLNPSNFVMYLNRL